MGIKKSGLIFVAGFGVLILIYLFLGLYGVVNSNKLNDLYENSYKNSLTEGKFTDSAYSNILNIQITLKDALLGKSLDEIQASLNKANEYGLLLQADISRLRTVEVDEFEQNVGLIEMIITEYEVYEINKDKVFTLLNNNQIRKCRDSIQNDLLTHVETMVEQLKTMVQGENEEVRQAYVSYKYVTRYTRVQMLIGVFLVVSFAIFLTFVIQRKVKSSKEELHKEKEELRITIDSIGDGVIVIDMELRIVKLNKVAENLTGWNTSEAFNKPFEEVFDIIDEASGEKARNPICKVMELNDICDLEHYYILRSRNGVMRHISDSAAPIRDLQGKVTGVVLIFHDITERRKKEEEIQYITYHDQVTKLYNRSFFEKQKQLLDNDEFMPISIIQGDINGLKLVNDAFGHAKGDELLCETADLLIKCCRKSDYVARVGGDEFTILLPNTYYDEARVIIHRIEEELQEKESQSINNPFFMSIALGAATKTKKEDSIDSIIKIADENMYKKKLLEKKSMHNSVLKSIKSTLLEKSHETQAHGSRLVELSKLIGEELGLPSEQRYELELLSNLHDIGVVGIPNQLLNKPGPLTDEEWIEMKKHPEIGYRIAHSIDELKDIANYILCHHERWDGKGYPQGLSGETIPLLSRIIAIVDAYDAMIENRPYKKSQTKEDALLEIERLAGTQFDPNIARIFVEKIGGKEKRI